MFYTSVLRDVQPQQKFSFDGTPKRKMTCFSNKDGVVRTTTGLRFTYDKNRADTEADVYINIHADQAPLPDVKDLVVIRNTRSRVAHLGTESGRVICGANFTQNSTVLKDAKLYNCGRCMQIMSARRKR